MTGAPRISMPSDGFRGHGFLPETGHRNGRERKVHIGGGIAPVSGAMPVAGVHPVELREEEPGPAITLRHREVASQHLDAETTLALAIQFRGARRNIGIHGSLPGNLRRNQSQEGTERDDARTPGPEPTCK